MKRRWTTGELLEHWSLHADELEMTSSARTPSNQLGFALLLKWFQYEGLFPKRKQDVPLDIVEHLARQLGVEPGAFRDYVWQGRTVERHRAQIRQYLGFQEATVQDAETLAAWLTEAVLDQRGHLRKNIRFRASYSF